MAVVISSQLGLLMFRRAPFLPVPFIPPPLSHPSTGERMVEISQLKDDLVHEMRRNDEETSHLQVKGQG